ncbi:bifunctional riboflavin kinase/FMN phosphatase-like [Hordeum vulgare subsp. vulgare]|uniref:bifunctional riboflavin kinase/FMN phosphatase-like n=1 Tax=Hordeum vulgare subsp. vulgare TaxID=112509 RepID=UPI001D1A4D38|nr:bifunctional riboflavin kinase/FMN phosphatase-like [Hordeum vulgare subsp. vulgare]
MEIEDAEDNAATLEIKANEEVLAPCSREKRPRDEETEEFEAMAFDGFEAIRYEEEGKPQPVLLPPLPPEYAIQLSPPVPARRHRSSASPCRLSGTSSTAIKHHVSAVIFDLDDTLLDTDSVTRGVLNDFLATYGKSVDAEKEEGRLGQRYVEYAAGIITDYGLPLTLEEYSQAIFPLYLKSWQKAKPLPGVRRLLKHLHKNGIPLALASNSKMRTIGQKIMKLEELKDCFSEVLGVDQVSRGKPCPDIYLEAAKRLGVSPSSCLVIEDSLVGIRGAKASGAMVVAVPSLQTERQRYSIADLVLCSLLDFHPELWGLPPFDDRIQGALPMEPLYSNAHIGNVISNNIHMIVAGEHTYDSVPGQLSGIVFGWAKLEQHGVSKVVVSIGWDLSPSAVGRVMHMCFLDPCCNAKAGEPLELLLVGYIRELQSTGSTTASQALSSTEEDQSIARDALDLPAFSGLEELTLFSATGKESSE